MALRLALWHWVSGMSDTGDFKAHRRDRGDRVPDQRLLGASNWARRFAPIEAAAPSSPSEALEGDRSLVRLARARVAVSKVEVKAGVAREPWEIEGISRRTWFRRKKAPVGGSVLKEAGSAGE